MQRISLLYVITKLELGGAQKQLLSLIRHLDNKKFRLFLFTAKDGILLSEALSINGLTIKRSRYLGRPINPFKDLLALIEIYRYIKKNNIRIVHTHSSKAGILGRLAARLARANIILHTVHGWSFNDYQPRAKRLSFIWLERFAAHFTDKLIVVSNSDKQKGLDNRIGRPDKYGLIRYGIDYSQFGISGQSLKKELGISADDLTVCMVSCFKPQKAPQDFIKLALLTTRALPGVKFLLVGDGILRKKVKNLILKFNLQDRVILTGWRQDIPRVLSSIDVFVLTSLWEGLPIAVLEAMASSKPVISTHTGAIEEAVIEGKTGFLVSPRNVSRMSERLIALLKDETLRAQMGQNALKSLGFDFSLANTVRTSEDTYGDLLIRKGIMHAS